VSFRYGLSNHPDIKQVVLGKDHKLLIVASDGLWDVCSAQDSVRVALEAISQGQDAAQALVDFALGEHRWHGGTADNTTVLVIQFK
jgi:protein phosphatase